MDYRTFWGYKQKQSRANTQIKGNREVDEDREMRRGHITSHQPASKFWRLTPRLASELKVHCKSNLLLDQPIKPLLPVL